MQHTQTLMIRCSKILFMRDIKLHELFKEAYLHILSLAKL